MPTDIPDPIIPQGSMQYPSLRAAKDPKDEVSDYFDADDAAKQRELFEQSQSQLDQYAQDTAPVQPAPQKPVKPPTPQGNGGIDENLDVDSATPKSQYVQPPPTEFDRRRKAVMERARERAGQRRERLAARGLHNQRDRFGNELPVNEDPKEEQQPQQPLGPLPFRPAPRVDPKPNPVPPDPGGDAAAVQNFGVAQKQFANAVFQELNAISGWLMALSQQIQQLHNARESKMRNW